jgi:hypothetical protein
MSSTRDILLLRWILEIWGRFAKDVPFLLIYPKRFFRKLVSSVELRICNTSKFREFQ